jgi:hypothetical protein
LSDDVGDWLDPLGLLSVTAEAVVVAASIMALCTGAESSGDDHRPRGAVHRPGRGPRLRPHRDAPDSPGTLWPTPSDAPAQPAAGR